MGVSKKQQNLHWVPQGSQNSMCFAPFHRVAWREKDKAAVGGEPADRGLGCKSLPFQREYHLSGKRQKHAAFRTLESPEYQSKPDNNANRRPAAIRARADRDWFTPLGSASPKSDILFALRVVVCFQFPVLFGPTILAQVSFICSNSISCWDHRRRAARKPFDEGG